MNACSAVAYKADSKPQDQERTVQQQVVEGASKTHSSENCQRQKDIGVKALDQHNSLPSVNQHCGGKHNVPAETNDTKCAPHLDECHRQLVHQKLGENENKPPSLSAASQEAVPFTSRAISDTGREVTHTR